VNRVATVVAAVADGDLTRSAGVSSRDEIGRMAAASELARMSAQLQQLVGQFRY
jgi:methyl-accepting chemotaxis protein